jgi:hypothetical protein
MTIKDFKESLDYLFKAQLTAFVWGHAGIGKTTAVKQYAESKGWHFFPFYLGTMSDLGDILGLQEFVENPDGTKSTDFAIPKWLKEAVTYCEEHPESGAVIFLDEFNRARRDIMNGMFSLALDKTFHTLKLPKNCHVIAAGNPPTEEYVVTDIDETALMARFVHIKLEPTVNEWVIYAKDKGLEPSLIGFIQEQPQLLEQQLSEITLPVKPDRRAYERLSRLFALKTPTHILNQLMTGIIGMERTVAYQLYMTEVEKPLTAEEVLSGKRLKAVKHWSNMEDVQASFLNITCDNVRDYMSTNKDKKLSTEEKKNFMDFLSLVPKDISYPLIKVLVTESNSMFRNFYTDPLYDLPVQGLVKAARGKHE